MLPARSGEFLLMSSGHQNGVIRSTGGDVIIKIAAVRRFELQMGNWTIEWY
jgi:hypothetical protein